ncbi:hypothetical protein BDW42DRAFT_87924 [Aspergillus taichungensis]|uniref:Uncharacterized protein n=1 Tax=Aspergillus taichungensis TaxID=482145 RepID=A0A2J5HWM7_9EURO|nr:hypothetical protein BDW42DRAFT_87924 [Aspergillus taichungensis]
MLYPRTYHSPTLSAVCRLVSLIFLSSFLFSLYLSFFVLLSTRVSHQHVAFCMYKKPSI